MGGKNSKDQSQANNNIDNNFIQQQQIQQQNYYSPQMQQEYIQEPQVQGTYNDDDDISDIKQNVKINKNNQAVDLTQVLNLQLKSLHKAININSKNSQQLPCMISLSSKVSDVEKMKKKEQTNEEKKDNLQSRPSIDLICVIDNSGSMQGTKIELVKQTLKSLLEFLNENDRLCLILFNSRGSRLTPLKRTSNQNKQGIFENQINQIRATGGTDINDGMRLAFKAIKERKNSNPVTSIFLLSDGLDGGAEKKVSQSLTSQQLVEENFTINSFGFGKDHDPVLMSSISSLKQGNFYFIDQLDQVDECFVDALGALFSVIAKDLVLDLTLVRENKFFSDVNIRKTFGNMWQKDNKTGGYRINLSQMISDSSKEYIFIIEIPPINEQLGDQDRNAKLLQVDLSAKPLEDEKPPVKLTSNLVITCFNENEKIAQDSEADENVEFNYLRVIGAEAMQQCIKEADQGNYQIGLNLLDDIEQKIEKARPETKKKLVSLQQDITVSKQSCQPQNYQNYGKHKLVSMQNAHMEQRSQAVQIESDMYMNSMQKQMVIQTKAKKR